MKKAAPMLPGGVVAASTPSTCNGDRIASLKASLRDIAALREVPSKLSGASWSPRRSVSIRLARKGHEALSNIVESWTHHGKQQKWRFKECTSSDLWPLRHHERWRGIWHRLRRLPRPRQENPQVAKGWLVLTVVTVVTVYPSLKQALDNAGSETMGNRIWWSVPMSAGSWQQGQDEKLSVKILININESNWINALTYSNQNATVLLHVTMERNHVAVLDPGLWNVDGGPAPCEGRSWTSATKPRRWKGLEDKLCRAAEGAFSRLASFQYKQKSTKTTRSNQKGFRRSHCLVSFYQLEACPNVPGLSRSDWSLARSLSFFLRVWSSTRFNLREGEKSHIQKKTKKNAFRVTLHPYKSSSLGIHRHMRSSHLAWSFNFWAWMYSFSFQAAELFCRNQFLAMELQQT